MAPGQASGTATNSALILAALPPRLCHTPDHSNVLRPWPRNDQSCLLPNIKSPATSQYRPDSHLPRRDLGQDLDSMFLAQHSRPQQAPPVPHHLPRDAHVLGGLHNGVAVVVLLHACELLVGYHGAGGALRPHHAVLGGASAWRVHCPCRAVVRLVPLVSSPGAADAQARANFDRHQYECLIHVSGSCGRRRLNVANFGTDGCVATAPRLAA